MPAISGTGGTKAVLAWASVERDRAATSSAEVIFFIRGKTRLGWVQGKAGGDYTPKPALHSRRDTGFSLQNKPARRADRRRNAAIFALRRFSLALGSC
ncbi:hypothetical protein [Vogesella indigofera]|uniref:hypothetical protein n=1 Tax=Vogesella indigofera TaxID=45465 RepID=UPI00234E3BF9|nr:hypothetical protein [Vogesella indigofera]MDC7707208.1 hypothetical protein [Vogesella indigofera]